MPESMFHDELAEERHLQRMRWGNAHDDQHPLWHWPVLLLEHVSKLAATITWDGGSVYFPQPTKKRLVVIAALCQSAYEAIERAEQH
jgi:hypothetical protein